MKKAIVIVVGSVFVALMMVVIIFAMQKDNVDYKCNFKYYNGEGQDGVIEVDYYKMSKDSTIIEVYKMDGSVWVIDSTQIEMYCIELED